MSDYSSLDKEDQERQKQAMIAHRKKKQFSALFMTIACVVEIIETLAIMLLLLIAVIFVFSKVIHLPESANNVVMTIMMILVFFGGLVLGFLVYRKLVAFVIKKFKLEDKLLDDVLIHYTKSAKDQKKKA